MVGSYVGLGIWRQWGTFPLGQELSQQFVSVESKLKQHGRSKGMKIQELLQTGRMLLHGSSAALDLALLIEAATGHSRLVQIAYPEIDVPEEQAAVAMDLLQKRVNGVPVAYLLGRKEFWGLQFEVSPAVLIPRPETELLVERALHFVGSSAAPVLRGCDLGTGSGCIAISVLSSTEKSAPRFQCVAIDRSREALHCAVRNAARLGVRDRFHPLQSSWLEAIGGEAEFDLIMSNPPYIADGDTEVSPETAFEPQSALYAGSSGLDAYRTLIPQCVARLRPGGLMLLECGAGQGAAIQEIAASFSALTCAVLKDLAEHDRVIEIRKDL